MNIPRRAFPKILERIEPQHISFWPYSARLRNATPQQY